MIQFVSVARAYSTPDAAKRIGVSYITLRRWLASGKVKVKAVGAGKHRLWIWTAKDIKRVKKQLKRK